MKAIIITEHGELDKVKLAEIAKPRPTAGEVLIQVKSAALNHLDIWVRKGRRGVTLSMPHVLGADGAGVVSEIGEGVEGIAVGDEVIINPGLSCGKCEYCRRGEQSECVSFSIVGMGRHGTFAEYVAVPAGKLKPVIDSVFPQDKFREAIQRMEQGVQFGKIVLKIQT
jgi:NADPH:quinone reductase-like Zn-dependent oxidoreductase